MQELPFPTEPLGAQRPPKPKAWDQPAHNRPHLPPPPTLSWVLLPLLFHGSKFPHGGRFYSQPKAALAVPPIHPPLYQSTTVSFGSRCPPPADTDGPAAALLPQERGQLGTGTAPTATPPRPHPPHSHSNWEQRSRRTPTALLPPAAAHPTRAVTGAGCGAALLCPVNLGGAQLLLPGCHQRSQL